MFNVGSVYFNGIPAAALGSSDAVNGLSVENSKVVLGQALGTAGDPAALLDNREIPIGSFSLLLRQGVFGTSTPGGVAVMLDGSVGGAFHAFVAEVINQPSGTILYRATNDDVNCFGAVMQMECSADGGVGQVACFGNAAGHPAYKRNAFGLSNTSVIAPDILLEANTRGAPTNRPGDIVMATNILGTQTETYRFLPPVSQALNFPNTAAQTSSDLNVTVTNARTGDAVLLGVPNAAMNANSSYFAWVSANDTVTVRFNNYSAAAIDPANATFKISVVRLLG